MSVNGRVFDPTKLTMNAEVPGVFDLLVTHVVRSTGLAGFPPRDALLFAEATAQAHRRLIPGATTARIVWNWDDATGWKVDIQTLAPTEIKEITITGTVSL